MLVKANRKIRPKQDLEGLSLSPSLPISEPHAAVRPITRRAEDQGSKETDTQGEVFKTEV